MQLKVKRLHPNAVMPKYQSDLASGFDLCALEDVTIPFGRTRLIRTGLAFEMPSLGCLDVLYEIQIRPRSGVSYKTSMRIANSPGTIDADYRGEIKIIVDNIDVCGTIEIKAGGRIAQAVVCPVFRVDIVEVDVLSNTERGEGGFGSTGVA